MPDIQPAGTVEQQVFAALKAEEQSIHAYLDTCPVGGWAATIGNWVTNLDDYFWHLLQFNAPAAWLEKQGFPAAEQYLQAMSRDFAGRATNMRRCIKTR